MSGFQSKIQNPKSKIVFVYRAALAVAPERLREYAALLAPDETERAANYRFDRDRNRYIVGRGILRVLFASILSASPESLRFSYSPFYKPALIQPDDAPQLHFNLAHSEDAALFAFAWDRTLGVDIEAVKSDTPCDELAQNYFAEAECAAYFNLPEPERRAAFFRIWTRKEAYVKARGEGLSLPLSHFDVSSGEADARLLTTRPDAGEADRWRMANLSLGDNFAGALVAFGSDWTLEYGALDENMG